MWIVRSTMRDRFGVTWHPSIAASIHAQLDRLDVVEVIPEGRFIESRTARRALRSLARTLPVSIHGVSLGLATAAPVALRLLDAFARLIGEVEPESWSEHLAFVRAGGVELGHLAAAPRTPETVEATAEHLELARRRVGSYPHVENISTPVEPPGSTMSEADWLLGVLDASPSDLLLDLHNLHTNALNFGFDAAAVLRALPFHRIRAIHIAGGVDVRSPDGGVRWIDDHHHDVPDPVYDLLEITGECLPHAVDVVLERDGAFPTFAEMLAQLDKAREALARGRERAAGCDAKSLARGTSTTSGEAGAGRQFRTDQARTDDGRRAAARVEAFLARVYTDDALRGRFLAAPAAEALSAGLTPAEARSFEHVDRFGIRLAAASFARKRGHLSGAESGGPSATALPPHPPGRR